MLKKSLICTIIVFLGATFLIAEGFTLGRNEVILEPGFI